MSHHFPYFYWEANLILKRGADMLLKLKSTIFSFSSVCMITDSDDFQNWSFLMYLYALKHEIWSLQILKERVIKPQNSNCVETTSLNSIVIRGIEFSSRCIGSYTVRLNLSCSWDGCFILFFIVFVFLLWLHFWRKLCSLRFLYVNRFEPIIKICC